jgi:prefoldin alpha subunit
MEKEKELQKKILIYQLLEKYADGLREQLAFLEKQMIDISTSYVAIDEIQNAKSDQEMFVGLGGGCWSAVKLQKEKQLLVNLGAGILAKQSIEQAKKILESRTADIQNEIDRIRAEFVAISEKLASLAAEIEKEVK